MLLIDEPETALHPSAVRAAKEHLYSLAEEAGWQVMLSTHHPAFVDPLKDHTTIVRLHRKDRHNTPNIYKSDSAKFNDEELENLKALLAFDSNVSEIFFGYSVILVEGDTEFAAFNEVMNIQKDAYPIEQRPLILRARGKATIAILAKILTQFKIGFSVLHDIDSPKTEKGDKKNPAYSINENIKKVIEGARELGLSVNYRCSCPNFEEHHKMKLPSKDKPFESWKAIRENKTIRDSVEAVLKDLISKYTESSTLDLDGKNYEKILKNWICKNNKSAEPRYKFE
ncbi:ATP-dependent nuclease [Rodentibacter abscessus]